MTPEPAAKPGKSHVHDQPSTAGRGKRPIAGWKSSTRLPVQGTAAGGTRRSVTEGYINYRYQTQSSAAAEGSPLQRRVRRHDYHRRLPSAPERDARTSGASLTFPIVRSLVRETFTALLFASKPEYLTWMIRAQRLLPLRI